MRSAAVFTRSEEYEPSVPRVQTVERSTEIRMSVIPYTSAEGGYIEVYEVFMRGKVGGVGNIEILMHSFSPVDETPESLLKRFSQKYPALEGGWERVL